jgi:hypothetical protein
VPKNALDSALSAQIWSLSSIVTADDQLWARTGRSQLFWSWIRSAVGLSIRDTATANEPRNGSWGSSLLRGLAIFA